MQISLAKTFGWLLLLSIIANTSNAAVNSFEWNPCWDLPLTDETLFCYGSVDWEISQTVYNELATRDQSAKNDYAALLAKWQATTSDTQNPTSD